MTKITKCNDLKTLQMQSDLLLNQCIKITMPQLLKYFFLIRWNHTKSSSSCKVWNDQKLTQIFQSYTNMNKYIDLINYYWPTDK